MRRRRALRLPSRPRRLRRIGGSLAVVRFPSRSGPGARLRRRAAPRPYSAGERIRKVERRLWKARVPWVFFQQDRARRSRGRRLLGGLRHTRQRSGSIQPDRQAQTTYVVRIFPNVMQVALSRPAKRIPSHLCCEKKCVRPSKQGSCRSAHCSGLAECCRKSGDGERRRSDAGGSGQAATRRRPHYRLRNRHAPRFECRRCPTSLGCVDRVRRSPNRFGGVAASAWTRSSRQAVPDHRDRPRPPRPHLRRSGGSAMRQLREIGGDAAIEEFAKRRVQAIVGDVEPADPTDVDNVEATADAIAEAFNAVGFAASTRPVATACRSANTIARFPMCRRVSGTVRGRAASIPAIARDSCSASGDHRQR